MVPSVLGVVGHAVLSHSTRELIGGTHLIGEIVGFERSEAPRWSNCLISGHENGPPGASGRPSWGVHW